VLNIGTNMPFGTDRITIEHPDLEKDDFPAVYRFAAEAGRRAKIS
jgi:hypothetical protein